MQANFRVLVLDEAARRVPGHGARCDADRSVDWADVVSVESCSPTPPACPICLEDTPHVAQVTPCGHTFCFGCIARHLLPKEALRGDVTASSSGPQPPPAARGARGPCGAVRNPGTRLNEPHAYAPPMSCRQQAHTVHRWHTWQHSLPGDSTDSWTPRFRRPAHPHGRAAAHLLVPPPLTLAIPLAAANASRLPAPLCG